MGCGASRLEGAELDNAGQGHDAKERYVANALLKQTGREFTTKVKLRFELRKFRHILRNGLSAVPEVLKLFVHEQAYEGALGAVVMGWVNRRVIAFERDIADKHNMVCELEWVFDFKRLQLLQLAVFDAAAAPAGIAPVDMAAALGSCSISLHDLLISQQDHGPAPDDTLDDDACSTSGRGAAASEEQVRHLLMSGGLADPGFHLAARVQEQPVVNAVVRLQLQARGLPNSDRFGKSDPYLRILRWDTQKSTWAAVVKTEVVSDNLNPKWQPLELDFVRLCNADRDWPLQLQVHDYDSAGGHDILGQLESVTFDELQGYFERRDWVELDRGLSRAELQAEAQRRWWEPRRRERANAAGELRVSHMRFIPCPGFLDYVTRGVRINFSVAVDFSASNGLVGSPGWLHALPTGPRHGEPNQYERAIHSIGRILEFYDPDKHYPMHGFGAWPRSRHPKPPHMFSMGENDEGMVFGVTGILQAYRSHVQEQLAGRLTPTKARLFHPVLSKAFRSAQHAHEVNTSRGRTGSDGEYDCLLLITSGVSLDLNSTINEIVKNSFLPISIIIVGIGDAVDWDASSMARLDSDHTLLALGDRVAERDIVQFVQFNKHAHSQDALAAEMLAEMPEQLLSYMRQHNILPRGMTSEYYRTRENQDPSVRNADLERGG